MLTLFLLKIFPQSRARESAIGIAIIARARQYYVFCLFLYKIESYLNLNNTLKDKTYSELT